MILFHGTKFVWIDGTTISVPLFHLRSIYLQHRFNIFYSSFTQFFDTTTLVLFVDTTNNLINISSSMKFSIIRFNLLLQITDNLILMVIIILKRLKVCFLMVFIWLVHSLLQCFQFITTVVSLSSDIDVFIGWLWVLASLISFYFLVALLAIVLRKRND